MAIIGNGMASPRVKYAVIVSGHININKVTKDYRKGTMNCHFSEIVGGT